MENPARDTSDLPRADDLWKERFLKISRLSTDYSYSHFYDEEGKITLEWYFGAFERITGYDPEECVKPEVMASLIHPDDWGEGKKRMERLLSGETVISEMRIVTKDGTVKWIEDKGVPEWDEGRTRVVRCIGTARDITERKEMEKRLRENNQLLQSFIDNFPDDAWAKNAEGKMILANRYSQYNTFCRPDVLGKTVYDFFPADVAAKCWTSEKEVFETGAPIQIEEDIPQADGVHRKILFKFPLYDSLGKINGLGGVAHDITEHENAKEALRASEEKFRSLFEKSNVGIAIGSPQGDLLEVNGEYLKITGYERHEFLGMNHADFTHPEDYEREKELVEELNRGKRDSIRLEKRVLGKEGDYIWTDTAITAQRNGRGELVNYLVFVFDISRRKNATMAMNSFFEQPLNLNLIGKIDGTILNVNIAWLSILGYSQEEVQGKKIFDFIHPEDLDATLAEIGNLEKGISTFYFENRYRHKEGHYITLAWSATFNMTDKRIYGVAKDITQQKAMNDQLERSEERYRVLVDTINSGVAIYRVKNEGRSGSDYIIQDFNKFALSHEKLTKEEILGKSLKDIRPNIDDYGLIDIFRRVWTSGRPEFSPSSLYMDENHASYYENRVFKLPGGEIVTVYDDVTERKLNEKQMLFLSAVTEYMHDAIIVSDLDGSISYINRSAQELYGYTLEEIKGRKPSLFNIDPRAEEIQQEIADSLAKGNSCAGEALNRRKDGSRFICEFKVAPMDDDEGNVVSFIGIQRDVTEMRNLEKAAIKQERLSAVGELASGVAHDFNNALQIILGGVELAMISESPDELKQYLGSIKCSAEDAASRVRKLQRFSQEHQLKDSSHTVDMNVLSDNAINEAKLLLNQYQKRGIHIGIRSDYRSKALVEGDEGELRSCLFNLIKNSAEAMARGGTITVSTIVKEGRVLVSVTDTGSGMDEVTQMKLFQPFFTTKGFEPGRGLGMAQVFSVIRDHKGDIYVKESAPGKGTVIEFSLPLSDNQPREEKTGEHLLDKLKILWVDDEEMIRSLGKKMLMKLGHEADFASGGDNALGMMASGKDYDLVITDVGMPGMSGWQLAEEIKSKGYNARVAIVIGWGAGVSAEDRARYSVGYVLGKPVGLKELKEMIQEILQMKEIEE